LQAVSNENGTEIILESTANGIGNYFYQMWQSAVSGQSQFQAIFLPWFWQNEYSLPVPADFQLTIDEEELLLMHKDNGMSLEHLQWRRMKLKEFSNDYESALELFSVEYPNTAIEAFRNAVDNRFINANIVNKARKNTVISNSKLVIGVDPAISDKDRMAVIRRKGRKAYGLETHYNLNTMQIAGLVMNLIKTEKPYKVFIDCIGIGAGIVDRLHEMGYTETVEVVNVARSANLKDKYRNLRAELWQEMKDWLCQEAGVQIPDSDTLLGDLTSLGYKFDSSGRLQIESKDDLRKRGMPSPDSADSLSLTFSLGEVVSEGTLINPIYNRSNAGLLI